VIDWWQWRNEPAFVGGLVLLGWLYAILAGPMRGRLAPGEPFPRAQAVRFYSALGLFYLAVGSPFGRAASAFLFSAHMAQNLVIMYPVAGLALLGLPAWMVDSALARPALRRPLGWLLQPLACGALFVLAVTAWHLPRLFERGLEDEGVHAIEHVMIFGVSLLFWWPLISPSRLLPPLRFGSRMIYLFCVEVALTALFTYLLMADHAIYPSYEYAPRLVAGLGAVDDQILGGILLSGVSSLVLLGALGISFRHWSKKDAHEDKPAPRP
jgi:putative membrane protein